MRAGTLRQPLRAAAAAAAAPRAAAPRPGAAMGAAGPAPPTATPAPGDPVFELLGDDVVHQRYLTTYNRRVRFPPAADGAPGPVHEYDVVGHPSAAFHYAVVFPFHPAPSGAWRDGAVTLLREYCQGVNGMVYCLPTGGFDPRKHADAAACARAELSEEAHLRGGRLERLLGADAAAMPGVLEVKWCANRFTPFIAYAPEPDAAPGARDREEYIEILRVPLPELRRLMRGGEMLLPSVSTCWWALERLAADAGEDLFG